MKNPFFKLILSNLSTVGHILLYNLYMNVAIAVLLPYWKSLDHLQDPKYENPTLRLMGITGLA